VIHLAEGGQWVYDQRSQAANADTKCSPFSEWIILLLRILVEEQ
jgi:hypothetical protein